MNASANPKTLLFKNIGPINDLRFEYKKDHIGIFALNGTGKSFIAKCFAYFDPTYTSLDGFKPDDILAGESDNGSFEFIEDGKTRLKLTLDRKNIDQPTTTHDNKLLVHVFTEAYIRQKIHPFDEKIGDGVAGAVAVTGEATEVKKAEAELNSAKDAHDHAKQKLNDDFIAFKSKLGNDFEAKNKNDFRNLDFDGILASILEQSKSASYEEHLKRYKDVGDLPEELTQIFDASISENSIHLDAVEAILRETVPTSDATQYIKDKISENNDFVRAGIKLYEDSPKTNCPFCEQDLMAAARELLDNVLSEIGSKEAKFIEKRNGLFQDMKQVGMSIDNQKVQCRLLRTEFEKLQPLLAKVQKKKFDTDLSEFDNFKDELHAFLKKFKKVKASEIASEDVFSTFNTMKEQFALILSTIQEHSDICNLLDSQLKNNRTNKGKVKDEALAFAPDWFSDEYKDDYDAYIATTTSLADAKARHDSAVEEFGANSDRKELFLNTFEELLTFCFGDKFKFDRDDSVLRLNDTVHSKLAGKRCFSDGELTVLAFCVYLAEIHKKVKRDGDYSKFLFVVDDPITSLSHNHIFTIASILKKFRIKRTDSGIFAKADQRPKIIVTTHNTYFFNVIAQNDVLSGRDNNSAYLYSLRHRQGRFIQDECSRLHLPFQEDIRHILEVSETELPEHYTGNSARAVFEGIQRFVAPNQKFKDFMKAKDNADILEAHNASHVELFEAGIVSVESRVNLCRAAKDMVEKYCPGQIEYLQK